ncbi:MAG: RluA family pseudouridine synthase [Planctomycetota bacterium]|jgi:RluA family pseudouridine synthase
MAKNKIDILFENDDFVVINKPTGTSVTADRSGKADVIQLLTKQLTLSEPLRLVHRLDKETSGVMMIAKNKETQSLYSSLFEKRQVDKLYLAIAQGPLGYEKGSIKDPIARSQRNPQAMHVHPRLGKPAHTEWKQLADFGSLSLVAVQLMTGRTHQIRVHFSHGGMPLAIDPVYGSSSPLMLSDYKPGYRSKRDEDERPLINRLTLHAYQLTIPVGNEENSPTQTFVAKPDKKFAAAIKMLNKHTKGMADGFTDEDDLQTILNAQPLPYLVSESESGNGS